MKWDVRLSEHSGYILFDGDPVGFISDPTAARELRIFLTEREAGRRTLCTIGACGEAEPHIHFYPDHDITAVMARDLGDRTAHLLRCLRCGAEWLDGVDETPVGHRRAGDVHLLTSSTRVPV